MSEILQQGQKALHEYKAGDHPHEDFDHFDPTTGKAHNANDLPIDGADDYNTVSQRRNEQTGGQQGQVQQGNLLQRENLESQE